MAEYPLLTAATATGSAVAIPGGAYVWVIGDAASGDSFGGTTATLQWRRSSAYGWVAVDAAAVATSALHIGVLLAAGDVRVLMTGGSSIVLTSALLTVPT